MGATAAMQDCVECFQKPEQKLPSFREAVKKRNSEGMLPGGEIRLNPGEECIIYTKGKARMTGQVGRGGPSFHGAGFEMPTVDKAFTASYTSPGFQLLKGFIQGWLFDSTLANG